MTTPSDKPANGPISSFAIGVLFGVAATYLFGTEEGRKIVKKIVDSFPEKHPTSPVTGHLPLIPSEETPHHSTYESPPPPAPNVRLSRPEPFTPAK